MTHLQGTGAGERVAVAEERGEHVLANLARDHLPALNQRYGNEDRN